MKTIIVYATKYGCTKKCAENLSKKLNDNVDLCNLKEKKDIDISQYDKVIVGGSIYIGKIQKEISEFCNKHLEDLKAKKSGIFICCMKDGEAAEAELKEAFPQELLDKAVVKSFFGGEFIFNKMNFLDRFIAKKVSKTDTDMSNILYENINRFAESMNYNSIR